ncbi:hypothetical protein DFH06DRAFT_1123823 [Mycena polygramma]|nr:hypothetical protein DFH06DRAFT_1123823 [Mycena polygramma]
MKYKSIMGKRSGSPYPDRDCKVLESLESSWTFGGSNINSGKNLVNPAGPVPGVPAGVEARKLGRDCASDQLETWQTKMPEVSVALDSSYLRHKQEIQLECRQVRSGPDGTEL